MASYVLPLSISEKEVVRRVEAGGLSNLSHEDLLNLLIRASVHGVPQSKEEFLNQSQQELRHLAKEAVRVLVGEVLRRLSL